MTECNGCGRCCDPVVSPFGPDDVRRVAHELDPRDAEFYRTSLTMIGRREGLRRADYLTQGGKTVYGIADGVMIAWSYFYECRWFDPETRACTNYDGRPPLCEGYPWYDDPPDRQKVIPPECSYNADVGQPVRLTTKPEPRCP